MRSEYSASLLLLFARSAATAQCAAPPLNLPIRTTSVVPGILSHGIPISVGTPPQHMVLTPSLQLDTPFIPRYTNSCIYADDTTVPASDTRWTDQDGKFVCADIYGGGYVPQLSISFFDNSTNSYVGERWFKKTRFSEWRFMADSFTFTDYIEAYAVQNDVLPDTRNVMTSFLLTNEGVTFGGLGSSALSLTPGSRVLETLVAEGMVPSKSWSLSNASLCLGCVDENAYTGEFQNFKVADRSKDGGLPCLLQVRVKSLDYHDGPTSEGVPLIENAFTACVDPGVRFLVLSKDVRAKLHGTDEEDARALLGSRLSAADSSIPSSGFLRFKLEGGLEVDVGNINASTVDAASLGDRLPSNGDGSWGAYGVDVPVIGKPFTDSLILRWDETTQEYGVANRNPKTDAKNNLKPLGCDDFPSISKGAETTPNVGIITGSIIGGFVAGLLFATAAVFFYWRGQRGVKSKYEAMRGEDAVSLRTVDTEMRGSLRLNFGKRSISPFTEPSLVGDSQVFEAPEGGTACPAKRNRGEMHVYSYDHR
ncbi:uncharacterized protein M421DRAFT_422866 [Didymella exigua CBS 183.55]|uniref:Peptidase A1 domain-containing protein n=1 Tax=Didymella exigua CBS 183.55 TaxID=1150837 RepID=A0A6A5RGA3_9PLEO|nr:uncharacterized protein M421DRAFT_422866 [Didymella exigua CBS 183.55]KAF1926188.1 hypothetical protein M421DRAFT_422866 [Didymella exigua CBS 183.55]